jgi:hypothetical protein
MLPRDAADRRAGAETARGGGRVNARSFALAAAWYLALALWVLKVVLTAPASTVAFPIDFAGNWERLLAADQNLRVAQVTTSARRLLHDPAHSSTGRSAIRSPTR